MTHIDDYTESQIQTLLAEDPGVAEQGITVVRSGDTLVLVGDVESAERCRQIVRAVNRRFPDVPVRCDITVPTVREPDEVEELS